MKIKLIALLVGTSLSAHALANENFSGFYLGAKTGYGFGKVETMNNNDANGHKNAQDNKPKGGLFGLQIGHNWQFDNNFVVGIESGINLLGLKKHLDDKNLIDDREEARSPYYSKDKFTAAGNINLKAGYVIDAFMPYITAGVTVVKNENTVGSYGKEEGGVRRESFNNTNVNYSVAPNIGIGAQYKVTDNLVAGMEYTYVDLGTKDVFISDPNSSAQDVQNRRLNRDYSTIAVQLNYQF